MDEDQRPTNRPGLRAVLRKPVAIAAGPVAGLIGAAVIAACGGSSDTLEVSHGTVIGNATIVDTRDGSLVTGQSIVIDGATIARITSGPVQVSVSLHSVTFALSLGTTDPFIVSPQDSWPINRPQLPW